MVKRREPGFALGEKEMLDGWLEYHRATLEMKCDGLTDEQLRTRSADPSTLSLMGLVRHMAEVERWWFRMVFADEEIGQLFDYSKGDDDADFNEIENATYEESLAQLKAEIERCREILAGASLDDMSKREIRPEQEPVSMRWIVTHMIEEYARHNGHADLLRERIDGATGD